MKTCKECGETKPVSEFHRNKSMADGHQSSCKPCRARYRAKYYVENHDREVAQSTAYRSVHKERLTARRVAQLREWRKENPEKQRLLGRAHVAVQRAIKRGTLVKPDTCERCGNKEQITAAHDSYDRPLDVRWLCRSCHTKEDRARPKIYPDTHEIGLNWDGLCREARWESRPATMDEIVGLVPAEKLVIVTPEATP